MKNTTVRTRFRAICIFAVNPIADLLDLGKYLSGSNKWSFERGWQLNITTSFTSVLRGKTINAKRQKRRARQAQKISRFQLIETELCNLVDLDFVHDFISAILFENEIDYIRRSCIVYCWPFQTVLCSSYFRNITPLTRIVVLIN